MDLKSNLNIVISWYNEDISWISRLKNDYNIIIYTKESQSEYDIPKNKGQEASVYLKYIIDNYNNLPEYTLFLHAHEYSPHHRGSIVDIIDNLVGIKTYYHNINDYKLGYIMTNPLIEYIKEWYSEYLEPELGPMSDYGDWTYGHQGCGQFIVHRNTIRHRSIEFYQNLYEWIMNTDHPNAWSSRFMEWTWHLMWEQVPKIQLETNDN